MAAPKGNQNALQHGKHAWAVSSRLPPHCGYIRRHARAVMVDLEALVYQQKGEVSVKDAMLLTLIGRVHGLLNLSLKELRDNCDKMTVAERQTNRKEQGDLIDRMTRLVKLLGFGESDGSGMLDDLYGSSEPVLTAPECNGDCQPTSETTAPSGQGGQL